MAKHCIRLLAGVWCVFVLVAMTGLTARASGELAQESLTGRTVAERCTKMEVSDQALWFATDEEGNVDIDQVVDAYPAGVIAIAAGFEYDCVPPKTTLVTVGYALTIDDDPWFSDEVKMTAADTEGVAYYPIMLKSDEPIPDGEYRVEFYLGDDLLTSGDVTVGGSETEKESSKDWFQKDQSEQEEKETEEPQPTEEQEKEREKPQPTEEQEEEREKARPTEQQEEEEEEQKQDDTKRREDQRQRENKVQMVGTITDGMTNRPIKGAVFIVLQPGVTAAQWADYGYPPSDIMTTNETDRNGQFRHQGLDRNVEYSVIAWALSYQGWWQDGFLFSDDDPDPYELDITLYR